jgi:hypothetical protein
MPRAGDYGCNRSVFNFWRGRGFGGLQVLARGGGFRATVISMTCGGGEHDGQSPRGPVVKRLLLLPLCVTLWSADAFAQSPERVFFAGGEAGHERSAFIGGVQALPGSSVGRGWALRGSLQAGRYGYERQGDRVRARYAGGELMLSRQWSDATRYGALSIGPRYTDTDLSPDDPGNRRGGRHWDAALQAEGRQDFGRWQVSGFSSYGIRLKEYYARADLTRRVSAGGLRAGVEAGFEGDESYDRQRVGAVIGLDRQAFGLRLSAGAKMGSEPRGGYVAVLVTRSF